MSQRSESDNKGITPAVFVTVCIALGLALNLFLLSKNYYLSTDGSIYAGLADGLRSGAGYSCWGKTNIHFPPFFPVLIAIFSLLTGDAEFSGHIISIISYLLSIPIIFVLGSMVFSRRAGYIACFLFATNMLVLMFSHAVMTHSVDILLLLSVMVLSVRVVSQNHPGVFYFPSIGCLLACAILNRPENILVSLGVFTALFFTSKGNIFRRSCNTMVSLAVALVILFPYANFLHRNTGRWTLTTKTRNLAFYDYMSDPDNKLMRVQKQMLPLEEFDPIKYVKEHDQEVLARFKHGTVKTLAKLDVLLYTHGVGIIFFLIGFAVSFRKRKRTAVLFIPYMLPFLLIPLGNIKTRYFLFSMPVFMFWIGGGIDFIYDRTARRIDSYKANARGLLVFFIGCLSLPLLLFLSRADIGDGLRKEYLLYREMGLWMRNNLDDVERSNINAVNPIYAYYSGCKGFEWTPWADDYEQLMDFLYRNRIKYLVVDDQAIIRRLSSLSFLLESKNEGDTPGIERLHQISPGGGKRKTFLYRVK